MRISALNINLVFTPWINCNSL